MGILPFQTAGTRETKRAANSTAVLLDASDRNTAAVTGRRSSTVVVSAVRTFRPTRRDDRWPLGERAADDARKCSLSKFDATTTWNAFVTGTQF